MSSSDSDTSSKPRTYLSTFVLNSWRRLWRSRESIVLEFYQCFALTSGITLSNTAGTSEARSVWLHHQEVAAPPTDNTINRIESRIVITERLSATWMVFWVNLLPMAVALYWLWQQLQLSTTRDIFHSIAVLICTVPLFFAVAIVGLLTQAVFVLPIVRLMNFLLPPIKVSG